MNDPREAWQERLLERSLREVVGGEQPPDLSARILTQLTTPASPIRRAPGAPHEPEPPRRRWRWADFLGGAAAAAALLTATLLLTRGSAPVHPVSVTVLAGELRWNGRFAALRGGSGKSWQVPMEAGDRVAALGESMTEARIDALGVLGMTAGSELEVRHMDWKQFGGGAALGSITVAVIAGAISWNSGTHALTATGGDTVQLKQGAPQEATDSGTPTARQARLEKELATALTRIKELEAERERRIPVVPVEHAASAPAPERKAEQPSLVAQFTNDELAEAIRAINWDTMGAASKEVVTLLAELARRLKEHPEDVPLDLAGKIQRWNGELVAQAQELAKHNVPGAGINGAFTHPLVQANLVSALLAKAGIPLSKDQQEALGALAQRYAELDRTMRAGFGADTPTLRQFLTEMELKEKFWGEMDNALDRGQRDTIAPEALRGSMMNVFSSGIVWSQFAKPLDVANRGELVGTMRDQLVRDLGIAAGDSVRIEEVVRGWAQGFSDDYWNGAANFGKPGGGRLDAVREAARRQADLVDRILATVPLDERQRRRLIGQKTLFLPRVK